MTTLITAETSEGERRCDARCYNARTEECRCVCLGHNHGVGESMARANTDTMARNQLRQMDEAGSKDASEILQSIEADNG